MWLSLSEYIEAIIKTHFRMTPTETLDVKQATRGETIEHIVDETPAIEDEPPHEEPAQPAPEQVEHEIIGEDTPTQFY